PTTYVGDVPKKPSARIPSSSEPSAPPTSVDCSPPASWRPSSTSSATPPPVPGATSPPSPSDHANWPTSSCPRSRWPYATVGQARSCMPTTTTTVCPQLRTTVCSPNCSVNNGDSRAPWSPTTSASRSCTPCTAWPPPSPMPEHSPCPPVWTSNCPPCTATATNSWPRSKRAGSPRNTSTGPYVACCSKSVNWACSTPIGNLNPKTTKSTWTRLNTGTWPAGS